VARPINRWDPSVNVDLFVKSADGPLVIDGADERWPLFCREWIQPVLYAALSGIGYSAELEIADGVDPLRGLQVRGYQYMPENMEFFVADPANGEPLPDDAADTYNAENYRYVNTGFRMALRGWIASVAQDVLNVDFQVRWGDGATRGAADTRGAWTGLVATLFDGKNQAADHLMYALHGKRLGDLSWKYRGAWVDDPASAFIVSGGDLTPWDGVDAGRVRLLITGGPPTWTVTTQAWDPGIPDWVDLRTDVVDLQSHAAPGLEDLLLLSGQLFHGATKVFPGAMPTPPPYQDTYFRQVSVSQFEPWVLDLNEVNAREYLARLEEMGLAPIPSYLGPVYTRTPVIDLVHYPEGTSNYAPEKVRDFDDDGGWGVEFNQDTVLAMSAIEDRKIITITPTLGKHVPVCLADDMAFGSQLPFTYVGRYKLKDMATWGDERCLVSFGFAGFRTAPPSGTYNGIGMTWRDANGGELVLKYWDNAAGSFLELVAPLRFDEYEGRVVDLGFSWTGNFGYLINRDNLELRIVVDGATVATLVFPALFIGSTWVGTIGTGNPVAGRKSFLGHWFGGATFYEPATDTDIRHAFDTDGDGGFNNPSFETAASSGRPGEAEGWEWQSFQDVGWWADFCAYRADLAPYRYGREGFEGGWLRAYSWAFADETARLAAGPFTADDVGKAAWQIDVNRNYILTNHSPITWTESAVGENQGAVADLPGALLAAALFNEGVGTYETTQEIFALWGFPPGDAPTYTGLPWFDSYNLIRPCEDVLGPYSGPTGFDGWYDHVFGTNLDPICTEDFEEAWGNDPLSTSGGQRWCPDTAPNGVMVGAPITFPLEIPPNENQIVIITDAAGPAMFSLPSNDYPDVATLVADLNAAVALHMSGLGLQFGSWSEGAEEGLTFGWDGVSLVGIWWAFAALESDRFRDMRESIGLRSFSPNGYATGVGIPAWLYPPAALPAGVATTDRFLIDSWSANSFAVLLDPVVGLWIKENDMNQATFDTAVPDPTILERFTLRGWVAPTAVWIPDLGSVSLTQALFDGGTEPLEQFEAAEWPDEPFPT